MSTPHPNPDYAPRRRVIDFGFDPHAETIANIDFVKFEADITRDRLLEIAERIRKLPYGEFIELCEAIGPKTKQEREDMEKALWRWSVGR